jgi:hypothetical protein
MISEASVSGVVGELAAQLSAFQAVLLLATGFHKLIARGRTQKVLQEFAGLPRTLAPSAVLLVSFTEILAGSLLCVPGYRAWGGVLAALIWSGYLALIAAAIVQGRRDVDCGCSFGGTHSPLGAYQVTRNLCLIATAVLAALSALGSVEALTVQQLLAACALLALYAALDQVMALAPPRAGVVR